MNIDFFDNPDEMPRLREDVRLVRTRLEVSPEGRRLAVDLELTPFIERPTVELYLANQRGEKAGLLSIIETLDRTISVVMHFRDEEPTETYRLRIAVYYASVDTELRRQVVDSIEQTFHAAPGNVVHHPAQT